MYRGPIAANTNTIFKIGQLSDPDPGSDTHHMRLWDLLARYYAAATTGGKKFVVICERFQYRSGEDRTKVELISKEYEGVVRLFCKRNPDVELVLQNAAQAVGKTAFWGDSVKGNQKIRTCGLWKPTMVHGMDAVRHYLYWITFTCKDNRYLLKLPKENVSA